MRFALLAAVFFAALAPAAEASPWARATLVRCDRDAREAVFEGRVVAYRHSAKMQLRFTLQAFTRDTPRWRKVGAAGFGEWITAPSGFVRYSYDKTVQALLAPAGYRAVVNFRWRDARGHLLRSERAISGVCRQPDSRPDLVLRKLHADKDGYVAVVANRGRAAPGPFDVRFMRDGELAGSARVVGLEPGSTVDVFLPGPPCRPGVQLDAVVDPGSEVDEADEENDALSVTC